jgi:hypothetical protein
MSRALESLPFGLELQSALEKEKLPTLRLVMPDAHTRNIV